MNIQGGMQGESSLNAREDVRNRPNAGRLRWAKYSISVMARTRALYSTLLVIRIVVIVLIFLTILRLIL